MKIMPCPLNGPRNISEFACAGEVVIAPDPNRCGDGEWADYVFNRSGEPGVRRDHTLSHVALSRRVQWGQNKTGALERDRFKSLQFETFKPSNSYN